METSRHVFFSQKTLSTNHPNKLTLGVGLRGGGAADVEAGLLFEPGAQRRQNLAAEQVAVARQRDLTACKRAGKPRVRRME